MKKYLFGFWIVALSLLMLSITFTTVKAEDKTSAIIGHVITQAIQGNDMDHGEVLGNELAALMHKFSIDMTIVVFQGIDTWRISKKFRLPLKNWVRGSLMFIWMNLIKNISSLQKP